ncbi:hypothetical protein COY95_04055 [Candidatus Woesearchaeota archaeon CG_4_10_14_0_8_um_filter_47_5]|nr:MAG: hypothetical protein COY95_04055 [Candidatus Woesearchaeota archaeon CG_4_10_14_0_8_um_filter_47_5]
MYNVWARDNNYPSEPGDIRTTYVLERRIVEEVLFFFRRTRWEEIEFSGNGGLEGLAGHIANRHYSSQWLHDVTFTSEVPTCGDGEGREVYPGGISRVHVNGYTLEYLPLSGDERGQLEGLLLKYQSEAVQAAKK